MVIPRKTGQVTAVGWELLAAQSIPRSLSIPEGDPSPLEHSWLPLQPRHRQEKELAGIASPEGAQGEQLTLEESRTPGIEASTAGQGWFVCRFAWTIPGSFPVTAACPTSPVSPPSGCSSFSTFSFLCPLCPGQSHPCQ